MDGHKNKALKQALERRISGGLPSNFNYHMMDRIRLEAVRQHRRRKIISWCWLIFGSLLILGLGLYVLAFYLGVDFKEYIPRKECLPPYTDLILFYWYIAVLVLILLGLDYWMRSHRRKTKEGRS
jgi:H+/Cl- antiporter ClcA